MPAVGRADADRHTYICVGFGVGVQDGSAKLGGVTAPTTVRLALAAWQLTTVPHCVPDCSAAARGSVALWLAAGRLTARVFLLLGGCDSAAECGCSTGRGLRRLERVGKEWIVGHRCCRGTRCCEAPMPMHAACCRAGRVHLCLSVCACMRALVSLASVCSG